MLTHGKSLFERFVAYLHHSHRTTAAIVFTGLMLDNLLLTVIVPIIPNIIYQIDHPDQIVQGSPACAVNQTLPCPVPSQHPLDLHSPKAKQAHALALMKENAKVGFLFSSKAFVQLLVNPFVGIASARYGYTMPLFFGLCVIFFASILFAVGSTFGTLLFARSVQGLGSSSMVISGMGLISSRYPDEEDRSKQMGIALSGIAAGVLIGYPFGSVIYEAAGKAVPFVLICLLIIILAVVQMAALPPRPEYTSATVTTSTKTLLRDPYILSVILVVCVSTTAMATLEPCLPLWLMETMDPEPWQLGTAFVPDSIGYFIGSSFFGVFALRVGRWKCSLASLICVGISAICIPFAGAIWHLILPHFGLGLGIGVIDASLMPMLAMLVDMRHEAVYGSVFAVAQIAVCSAYSLGPLLGGLVANSVGFPFLMRTIGVVNLLICPICLYLRHIPSRPDNQQGLLNQTAIPTHEYRRASRLYHTLTSESDDSTNLESVRKQPGGRRKSSVRPGRI